MDENISVLPKLSDSRFRKKSNNVDYKNNASQVIDPDVESIMSKKSSNNFDVLNMKHESTDEELNKTNADTTADSSYKYNWMIITLSFIVIVLIVVLAWYFLSESYTDAVKPACIPPNIVRQQNNNNDNTKFQQMMYNQAQAQSQNNSFVNQQQQNYNNNQSENLNIQTKSLKSKSSKQPTKNELELTLKKLKTIDEDDRKITKKITQSSRNEKLPKIVSISDSDSDDEIQDQKLVKKFTEDLQKNIDIDEIEEDNCDDK
jgi:hypothetical protein